MARPVHFEIPSDNPDKAMKFYEEIFGWKFQKWDGPMPYWMITTGPDNERGINGGMLPRRDPQQPCVNTIDVADIDASIANVESHGGQCVVPKMPVPSVGWLAYCKDLDGNIFGMMQMDAGAK
ncbi:MAG TPA: VOC family protein [Verrucomicrobiae bacterium]|nr:VOC family protein [Verrucomicrobiae bacterium]